MTSGAYNERRSQCEAAAKAIGVPSLRTATMEQVGALPAGKTQDRARHVVTENERVLKARDALREGKMDDFGRGAIGMVGWTLLSRAYQVADVGAVAPFEYAYLPMAALLGYLVFDEIRPAHRPDEVEQPAADSGI